LGFIGFSQIYCFRRSVVYVSTSWMFILYGFLHTSSNYCNWRRPVADRGDTCRVV
jgi:hypothetical protein